MLPIHHVLLTVVCVLAGVLMTTAGEPRVARKNAPVPKKTLPQAALEKAYEIGKTGTDPNTRVFDLGLIGWEFMNHGDKVPAKRVFQTAADMARKGSQREHDLTSVAELMATAGLVKEAVEILEEAAADSPGAEHHRANFARFLRNSGALLTLQKLADNCSEERKGGCLAVLAAEQAGLGKVADAEQTLKKIDNYEARATAWAALAVAQHRDKDTKAAKATLHTAVEAFDTLTDGQKQAYGQYPYSLLAVAYARIGEPDTALKLARANRSQGIGWMTVRKIGQVALEDGNVEQVLRLADGVKDPFYADNIRADVVNYHLARKDFEQARGQADKLTCVYWKVRSYQELAAAYSKAEKPVEAKAAFASALDIAGPNSTNVKDADGVYGSGGLRVELRNLTFRTRAEMGQVLDAMEDAEKVERPRGRLHAYLNIARGLRPTLPNEEK